MRLTEQRSKASLGSLHSLLLCALLRQPSLLGSTVQFSSAHASLK